MKSGRISAKLSNTKRFMRSEGMDRKIADKPHKEEGCVPAKTRNYLKGDQKVCGR